MVIPSLYLLPCIDESKMTKELGNAKTKCHMKKEKGDIGDYA